MDTDRKYRKCLGGEKTHTMRSTVRLFGILTTDANLSTDSTEKRVPYPPSEYNLECLPSMVLEWKPMQTAAQLTLVSSFSFYNFEIVISLPVYSVFGILVNWAVSYAHSEQTAKHSTLLFFC